MMIITIIVTWGKKKHILLTTVADKAEGAGGVDGSCSGGSRGRKRRQCLLRWNLLFVLLFFFFRKVPCVRRRHLSHGLLARSSTICTSTISPHKSRCRFETVLFVSPQISELWEEGVNRRQVLGGPPEFHLYFSRTSSIPATVSVCPNVVFFHAGSAG